ncbi:MAG: hypothetical protein AUK63_2059 [bacterium P3]|nr:MAG: hypothetical protein AUK63_2059 [bacterium P3]KWW33255.1 MAG: hypothetical protein F083_2551 [bacterium F083]
MARNKYNELKKARKAKMRKLRLQHAIWSTSLVVLSLMIAYVSPALLGKIHTLSDFMGNQATIGWFTANMLAIVSTTFNKMSADFHVKGSTFGYSVLAFIVVGYIYAQAVHIGLLHVSDYWLVSPVVVTMLHLAFVALLFALSFSKGIYESNKELL